MVDAHNTKISFGVLFMLHGLSFVMTIPFWAFTVASACLAIHIGAVACIVQSSDGSSSGSGGNEVESMSRHDVYMFPVAAACSLTGLYLAFKFLDAYWVNLVLRSYFIFLGTFGLAATFRMAMESLNLGFVTSMFGCHLFDFNIMSIPIIWRLFKSDEKEDSKPGESDDIVAVCLGDIPIFIMSVAAAVIYLQTHHWALNNLFGLAFSIQGLKYIDVGSFKNAAILLTLLFFYDIFFVFGTEIMVKVAMSFEAPIKLLFPRGDGKKAMLGLGDIVLPGLLISLMIKFDVSTHLNKHEKSGTVVEGKDMVAHVRRAPLVYFWASVIAYALSLCFTLVINIVFKHPQPALLYLVPGCLISCLCTAVVRGEFKELWNFSTENEEESGEEVTEKKDK
eukprot:82276_1